MKNLENDDISKKMKKVMTKKGVFITTKIEGQKNFGGLKMSINDCCTECGKRSVQYFDMEEEHYEDSYAYCWNCGKEVRVHHLLTGELVRYGDFLAEIKIVLKEAVKAGLIDIVGYEDGNNTYRNNPGANKQKWKKFQKGLKSKLKQNPHSCANHKTWSSKFKEYFYSMK